VTMCIPTVPMRSALEKVEPLKRPERRVNT
jgi:hypothetical protein